MCGIVGLHLRNPDLYPRLGELLTGMLCEMANRGSDSSWCRRLRRSDLVAAGRGGVSLVDVVRCRRRRRRRQLTERLGAEVDVVTVGTTLSVDRRHRLRRPCSTPSGPPTRTALIAGFGADLAVLKGVGDPRTLTDAWGLATAQGWQGVGHTRMATESAVTPSGCHPYAVGPEQCLVHNGSFANHATIRRELRAAGVRIRQRERHRGRRTLRRQAAGRRPRRRDRAEGTVRDVRRLLHAAGVQPGLVRRGSRRHRVQARRDRRDRRLGGDGQRIPRAVRPSRRRERPPSGSPSRRWSTHGRR